VRSLLITSNPVLFSAAEALMKESGLAYRILGPDTLVEDSGVQQIIVGDDDYEAGRKLLDEGLKPVRPESTEWA
jgi:Putative prokaryotic signal transducing protein